VNDRVWDKAVAKSYLAERRLLSEAAADVLLLARAARIKRTLGEFSASLCENKRRTKYHFG
jgi:transcription initiation factor TFIIIB Brf1 subunit/transcription initiation factor TFIIB